METPTQMSQSCKCPTQHCNLDPFANSRTGNVPTFGNKLLILFGLATFSFATLHTAPLTWTASYDGSSNPASGGWQVNTIGGASLTWNDPAAGIATFEDPSTSGGTVAQISKTPPLGTFGADPSQVTWSISTRLLIESSSVQSSVNPLLYFGFTAERGTTDVFGKYITLGIYLDTNTSTPGNQTGLAFTNFGGAPLSGGIMSTANYADGVWHTYTMLKYLDEGNPTLAVLVDGNLVGTINYNNLPNASNAGSFTISSTSPSASSFQLDYITVVPEPASAFSFLLGLAILGLRRIRTNENSQA